MEQSLDRRVVLLEPLRRPCGLPLLSGSNGRPRCFFAVYSADAGVLLISFVLTSPIGNGPTGSFARIQITAMTPTGTVNLTTCSPTPRGNGSPRTGRLPPSLRVASPRGMGRRSEAELAPSPPGKGAGC